MIYNNHNNNIYLQLLVNNNVYFFTLDADGSTLSIHIANDFNSTNDAYLVDSQTLLMSIRSPSTLQIYLVYYYISNASFSQYTFSNTGIVIWDISYTATSNRLVLYGTYGQYVYVVQTLSESILDVDDISEEPAQIFNVANASSYQMSSVTLSAPPNISLTIDNWTNATLVNRTMVRSIYQYSDLVYFIDTPTDPEYFNLMENWNKSLSINITCSISGSTSLEHTIEDYGNYTFPHGLV